MATLVYNGKRIGLAPHVLAEVHALVSVAFPTGKCFSMGLVGTDGDGDVFRDFLWMHPSIPLEFIYDESETAKVKESVIALHLEAIESVAVVVIGDAKGWLPFAFERMPAGVDAQ
ncbi:hypothetical protein M1M07_28915 [Rhodococcus sp. HM1]|uniref:DUF7882 family protein n=1 Tax=Rhodococcus sp. HM1 TaxID=2937759 RepID=UPI00200A1F03|nr:hypothetical protein [Rhodococcus sp. HM1]MCK8675115.1 hypothetical protein [Rhodococcus sp. HM1]